MLIRYLSAPNAEGYQIIFDTRRVVAIEGWYPDLSIHLEGDRKINVDPYGTISFLRSPAVGTPDAWLDGKPCDWVNVNISSYETLLSVLEMYNAN